MDLSSQGSSYQSRGPPGLLELNLPRALILTLSQIEQADSVQATGFMEGDVPVALYASSDENHISVVFKVAGDGNMLMNQLEDRWHCHMTSVDIHPQDNILASELIQRAIQNAKKPPLVTLSDTACQTEESENEKLLLNSGQDTGKKEEKPAKQPPRTVKGVSTRKSTRLVGLVKNSPQVLLERIKVNKNGTQKTVVTQSSSKELEEKNVTEFKQEQETVLDGSENGELPFSENTSGNGELPFSENTSNVLLIQPDAFGSGSGSDSENEPGLENSFTDLMPFELDSVSLENEENVSQMNDGKKGQPKKKEKKCLVKYETYGTGPHKVTVKRFKRVKEPPQTCIICQQELGGISSLHRHVEQHHEVQYKEYRKVEVSLELQNKSSRCPKLEAKLKKLKTLEKAEARKMLQQWKTKAPHRGRGKAEHKEIKCPICEQVIRNIGNFRKHVRNKHKSENFEQVMSFIGNKMPDTVQFFELFSKNGAYILQHYSGDAQNSENASETGNDTNFEQALAQYTCLVCCMQLRHRYSFLRHIGQHHFLEIQDYMQLLNIESLEERQQKVEQILEEGRTKRLTKKKERVLQTQSDRSLFQCPGCEETLVEANTLILHVKRFHNESPDFPQLLLTADEQCTGVHRRKTMTEVDSFMFKCPYCECERVGRSVLRHLKNCHEWEVDFNSVYNNLATDTVIRAKEREQRRKKKSAQDAYDSGVLHTCRYCKRDFKHRASKSRHETFGCRENPNLRICFWCNICGKRIDRGDREAIANHKSSCCDPRTYVCHLCGKICKSKNQLSAHKRSTHDDPETLTRHICPVCGKRYYKSTMLRSHMAKHSDVRNCQCELCGKQFKTPEAVRKHQNCVHLNKYPYRCNDCGHGMQKQSYLKSHQCGRVRRIQQDAKDEERPAKKKTPKPSTARADLPAADLGMPIPVENAGYAPAGILWGDKPVPEMGAFLVESEQTITDEDASVHISSYPTQSSSTCMYTSLPIYALAPAPIPISSLSANQSHPEVTHIQAGAGGDDKSHYATPETSTPPVVYDLSQQNASTTAHFHPSFIIPGYNKH